MTATFGLSLCDFERIMRWGNTEHERVAEGRGGGGGGGGPVHLGRLPRPYPRSTTVLLICVAKE